MLYIQPSRSAAPVQLVDLAPTVLDLLGMEPLPAADGQSIAEVYFCGRG